MASTEENMSKSATEKVARENASRQEATAGPIIIEASWAPTDPRDKLYDETATQSERAHSAFRIFASFHPLLNIMVLITDSLRNFGLVKSLALWAFIFASLYGLLVWLAA